MVIHENPDSFLGIQMTKKADRICLKQGNYAETILKNFNMHEAKPPMMSCDIHDETETPNIDFPFREAIG
ncbi:hypothetical protein HHI36_021780, partial [Cryptolaemus montrouzieri]